MPRAAAASSNSATIDAMVGAKVASSTMRGPESRASSIIASLGLSTGIVSSFFAASIAVPKAEQVKRMPSAPVSAP